MKLFGLIGNPLSHSYSEEYFSMKFRKENIQDCQYRLFQLKSLDEFNQTISDNPDLLGLNVTIPFKKEILKYLDNSDQIVERIKAVNCIKIDRSSGKLNLTGYNTDVFGFEKTIKPLLTPIPKKALILGTGGSAFAVAYVLKSLNIESVMISRNPKESGHQSYNSIHREMLLDHLLIINATPVGMFPMSGVCPEIPYEFITSDHVLYDLVYNPELTLFLKKGKEKGARIKNGLEMLHFQAEKSWEIWQN